MPRTRPLQCSAKTAESGAPEHFYLARAFWFPPPDMKYWPVRCFRFHASHEEKPVSRSLRYCHKLKSFRDQTSFVVGRFCRQRCYFIATGEQGKILRRLTQGKTTNRKQEDQRLVTRAHDSMHVQSLQHRDHLRDHWQCQPSFQYSSHPLRA
jgi:hypothetical protein